MRHSPLFFAFAAPLLFACGLGVSQNGVKGGGRGGGGADAGSACPADIPTIQCLSCGEPVDTTCVNGQWECPAEPPCPPPLDGGTACDNLPEPACTGCNGESLSPTCTAGVWQCPLLGCPIEVDGGCGPLPVDECFIPPPCEGEYYAAVCAGATWTCVLEGQCTAADAGQSFACGSLACDPATTYCNVTTGGPVALDGGGSSAFACDLLPTACTSGHATCACLGFIGNGCSCVEQHGDVTLTCELP